MKDNKARKAILKISKNCLSYLPSTVVRSYRSKSCGVGFSGFFLCLPVKEIVLENWLSVIVINLTEPSSGTIEPILLMCTVEFSIELQ